MRNLIAIVEALHTAPFPGLTKELVRKLRQIRHECRVDNGGGGACHLVSEWLEAEYGWTQVSGVYTTHDYKEPAVVGHYWNLLPNGAILDATADQLGEGHDIRVIEPHDANYHRYRPEFYDDFKPDHPDLDRYLSNKFPHLDRSTIQNNGEDDYDWSARLATARGHHWWATDAKQLARYRAMQKRRYGTN